MRVSTHDAPTAAVGTAQTARGRRRHPTLVAGGAFAIVLLFAVIVAAIFTRFAPSGTPADGVSRAGTFTAFPTGSAAPRALAWGPDGNLWFTGFCDGGQCGALPVYCTSGGECGATMNRMTPTGKIAQFSLGRSNNAPLNIAVGPDGNLWFTENNGSGGYGAATGPNLNHIGRITLRGDVAVFGTDLVNPTAIAVGPDRALWFGEKGAMGRITTAGTITRFPLRNEDVTPTSLALGPDGNLWFSEFNGADIDDNDGTRGAETSVNLIGRITPSGAVTEFPVARGGRGDAGVTAIIAGPDGNLWFVNKADPYIGRITPSGVVTKLLLPAGPADVDALARPLGAVAITRGPDNNLWFLTTCQCAPGAPPTYLGRITPAGVGMLIPFPSALTGSLISGPDGNLWATDAAQIWRYTPRA